MSGRKKISMKLTAQVCTSNISSCVNAQSFGHLLPQTVDTLQVGQDCKLALQCMTTEIKEQCLSFVHVESYQKHRLLTLNLTQFSISGCGGD